MDIGFVGSLFGQLSCWLFSARTFHEHKIMWLYSQTTGTVKLGTVIKRWTGYSGFGEGRNNPVLETVHDLGPIPKGLYAIGPVYDDPHLGPCVMHLTPIGHDAHDRTLFRIHGDNATHDASHGCIILPKQLREEIAASTDRELGVME
jgi:hypothetical protein